MHFQFPFLLVLIPILFGIWYFLSREKWWFYPPNPLLKNFLTTPTSIRILYIFRFFIIATFCIIISVPTFRVSYEKKFPEKQHILLVLDISRSMLAEDISPSRISVAKNIIKNFVQARQDDIFGLILFAGKPFLIINNSSDTDGILHFIDSISPDYILQNKPQLSGTNIGDALLLAKQNLEHIESKKNIILITDGSANVGIDPLTATKEIKKINLPVYTVGIGQKNNEPIFYTDSHGQKNFFYNTNGEKILNDLDKELLQKIAIETNWEFLHGENVEQLQKSFENIDEKIWENFTTEKKEESMDLTPIFLILLITFWGMENFLKKYIYKKYNLL